MTKKQPPPPPPSPLLTDVDVVLVKNRKKNGDDDEEDDDDDAASPTSLFYRMIDSSSLQAPPLLPPPSTTGAVNNNNNNNNSISISISSRLSRFLKWYATFMSSAGNQEIGLKVLQYTLAVTAKVIGNSNSNSNSNSSHSNSSLQRKQRIAAFCSKLSNDLSFARYMTRLFGLPTAMEAALHGSWTSDSALSTSSLPEKRKMSRLDAWLGKILAYSMVLYYPAEHVAFVHWMAPPPPVPMPAVSSSSSSSSSSTAVGKKKAPPPRTAERWSAWSCRCWVVYVVAEIVQCLLQYRKQRHEKERLLLSLQQQQQQQDMANDNNNNNNNNSGTDDDSPTSIITKQLQETNRALRNVKLQLLRNALFFLPTLHWSLPNWDTDPWLPSSLVNTLMWLESMVHFYKNAINS